MTIEHFIDRVIVLILFHSTHENKQVTIINHLINRTTRDLFMKKEILSLNNVSIGIHEELIKDISLSFLKGDKIGIIGSNGSGKTTLLKSIAGLVDVMKGLVACKGSIDYVPQLHATSSVSGGQQSFGKLSEAFEKDSEVLLLDEPTNHLDTETRERLIKMTQEYKGVLICVSHDAWFLNQITNKLLIIENESLRMFTGSYSDYLEEIKKNTDAQSRRQEAVRKEAKKLEEAQKRESVRAARSKKVGKAHNLDRSTGRGAQGYFAEQAEKAAARNKRNSDNKKEEINEKLKTFSPVKKKKVMSHIETSDSKGSLFRISQATLTVAGNEILQDVSLGMMKGERIALEGNNGSGKSALIKALLNKAGFELSPKPFVNEKLRIEYLDQHYSLIDPNRSVLDNVIDFAGVAPERAREHLSHFLFSETVGVSHKASTLSGGMLARLAFVMLTIAPIDLLILDEPTNNLDMETIDAIADLLLEYHGGLLVISHDVSFLEKLNLEKTYTVKDGTVIS